ncbi:MAG: hypothetical protein QXV17_15030 [Candidatus Micrarchaeaceae archaeon]
MAKTEISEEYEIDELDEEEQKEKDKEVDVYDNPATLMALEICLERLPKYTIMGKGLEWTDFFYRCRIWVDKEEDAVYASSPISIEIFVTDSRLIDVLNKAKELLETKIKEMKERLGK